MHLEKNVMALAEQLNRFRAVTLTIFFNAEASAQRRRETGVVHSNVISPNFVVFPAQIDTLETSRLEQMRALWLKSNKEQAKISTGNVIEESLERKFERMLGEAMRVTGRRAQTLEERFIRAARYPVPSEYAVVLPENPKSLRHDIIDTLVPFRDTQALLFRLEESLELPIRAAVIGHTRAAHADELKASIKPH